MAMMRRRRRKRSRKMCCQKPHCGKVSQAAGGRSRVRIPHETWRSLVGTHDFPRRQHFGLGLADRTPRHIPKAHCPRRPQRHPQTLTSPHQQVRIPSRHRQTTLSTNAVFLQSPKMSSSEGKTKKFGKQERVIPAAGDKALKYYPAEDDSAPRKVSGMERKQWWQIRATNTNMSIGSHRHGRNTC